jgi:hypothetical protein
MQTDGTDFLFQNKFPGKFAAVESREVLQFWITHSGADLFMQVGCVSLGVPLAGKSAASS